MSETKEKCPVCKTECERGATACSACGFTDNLGINRTWAIKEDLSNWLETVVKPYRVQWETKKREAEMSVQTINASKKYIVLGIAVLGVIVMAIITYATKFNANLDNPEDLFKRGREYVLQGKYDEAITDFTAALKIDPTNINCLYGRGGAHFLQGKYDETIADYTAALKIDPSNINFLYGRGNAYLLNKEYDNAITDFTNALVIKRDYPAFLFGRGGAYLLKEDYKRAIDDYELILSIEPDHVDAKTNLKLAREKIVGL